MNNKRQYAIMYERKTDNDDNLITVALHNQFVTIWSMWNQLDVIITYYYMPCAVMPMEMAVTKMSHSGKKHSAAFMQSVIAVNI